MLVAPADTGRLARDRLLAATDSTSWTSDRGGGVETLVERRYSLITKSQASACSREFALVDLRGAHLGIARTFRPAVSAWSEARGRTVFNQSLHEG